MANKLSDLFVKLGLNSSSFNKGINSAQKKTNKFGEGLKKIGGLIAGAFAVGAIVNFTKESVRLFNIQAQAENQLLVALKGRSDVQRLLIDQASELQGKTLFGDEETIQAQALIAAFVKEGEQIKKVIPLVQDLAVAKGMQLSVAADLVSKTLGSSTNALSRYGIEVEGAVGSVERLESLMNGLSDAFEGQAEAAAKVGSGPIKQLQNAYGDLKEEIGKAIATGGAFVGFINSIGTSLTKTQQLMFVWNSEFATTIEKWAISLELSDKRAEAIFKRVKKRSEEETQRRKDLAAELQAIIDKNNEGNDSEEESVEIKEKHIQTIGELKAETDELKASLDLYNLSQKDEFLATKAQIEANEALIKSFGEVAAARSARSAAPARAETKKDAKVTSDDVFGLEIGKLNAFIKKNQEAVDAALAPLEASVQTMNEILEDGVENMIVTLADGFGRLAVGDIGFEEFGNIVLDQIGAFLSQMGQYLIAYGFAMEAFKKAFTNPFLAIAAGVALVAIGGAISGLASKGVSSGNISPGGGAGGSTGGFNQGGTRAEDNRVVFELEGTKLVGVLDNTSRRTGIIA